MKNKISKQFADFFHNIFARFSAFWKKFFAPRKTTNHENPVFAKLRNRLVLINVVVSTIVLVVAFSTIYFVAENSGRRRPPSFNDNFSDVFPKTERPASPNDDFSNLENDVTKFIHNRIQNEREEAKKSLLTSLFIIGAGVELCVVILSYWLAENAIRPVKNAYNSQKIFIANASHEIKAPLAAISANFEAGDFPENQWTKNIARKIEFLTNLNNDLLALAQADNMQKTIAHEKVDLEKLLTETIQTFAPQISEKRISLEINTKNLPAKTEIAKQAFLQIVTILFDNALKYCDMKIQVSLMPHKLEIKNDGAKIPVENLPHIFERFYQTDKNSAGVGLGLAIAKALADRENWKLLASSDEFTTFVLEF